MVRKIEACGVEKDTMINNLIIRQETEEDYKKTESFGINIGPDARSIY